jgi:hypothetical protein
MFVSIHKPAAVGLNLWEDAIHNDTRRLEHWFEYAFVASGVEYHLKFFTTSFSLSVTHVPFHGFFASIPIGIVQERQQNGTIFLHISKLGLRACKYLLQANIHRTFEVHKPSMRTCV